MSAKVAETIANVTRSVSPTVKKNGVQPVRPEATRTNTESSVASAVSAAASTATSTATSTAVSTPASSAVSTPASTAVSSTASVNTISAHKTDIEVSQTTTVTKTTLVEACFGLKISEMGVLTGQCLKWNGTLVETSFNVNEYIINIDGKLVWDGTQKFNGFKDSCTDIEIVSGFILKAKCRTADGKNWVVSTFDLSTRLRVNDGRIVIIQFDEKFTQMFTEVPWMKFKVIAEPDFSVLAGQTVVRDTMIKLATSTVQHVTVEMESKIRAAIALAIQEVTASATQYIQTELSLAVRQTHTQGSAQIYPSCTFTQPLHQMIPQDLIGFKDIYSHSEALALTVKK